MGERLLISNIFDERRISRVTTKVDNIEDTTEVYWYVYNSKVRGVEKKNNIHVTERQCNIFIDIFFEDETKYDGRYELNIELSKVDGACHASGTLSFRNGKGISKVADTAEFSIKHEDWTKYVGQYFSNYLKSILAVDTPSSARLLIDLFMSGIKG